MNASARPLITRITIIVRIKMAEPLGLVAVGMTAAHIAKILFNVAQNYNSAREEISDIAEELTIVSQNMVLLNDILANHHDKCKPALFQQVQSIVGQFKKVEAKLNKVIDARKPLQRIRWFIDSPQTRALLTKIESIKTSLILVVGLIRLAHEQTQKQ